MVDKNEGGAGVPANSLLAAALIATGALIFYPTAPLTIARPQMTDTAYRSTSHLQDIEARQWEDPFSSGMKTVEEAVGKIVHSPACESRAGNSAQPKTGTDASTPFHSPLAKLVSATPPALLAVTAPGAPYFEDGEYRRRLRYAVIGALHAEGYEPENGEHIGYFLLKNSDGQECSVPGVVFFEWFRSSTNNKNTVLLLWVDEEALATGRETPREQLARLRNFVCMVGKKEGEPADRCDGRTMPVIGPSSSAVLKKLCESPATTAPAPEGPRKDTGGLAAKALPPAPNLNVDMSFYAYGATGRLPPDRCADLTRTIAPDNALAEVIHEELVLRSVKLPARTPRPGGGSSAGDHIVLLSEHDTVYGRNIQRVFSCVLSYPDDSAARLACEDSHSTVKPHAWISATSYLRGLDGALAPTTTPAKGSSEKKNEKDKNGAKTDFDAKKLEQAFGQAQFDYLRRTAAKLQEQDRELRRNGGKIAAVGVLGNDVFDKLLLLRALKPVLPEAIFFTTDYDAALSLADDQQFTRNLVIASSYGPQLNDDLQRDAPPWRSVYQVSAYLSTRLALRKNDGQSEAADQLRSQIETSIAEPRLFEMNRAGVPVELSLKSQKAYLAQTVFAPAPPAYPPLSQQARVGAAMIFAIVAGVAWSMRGANCFIRQITWTWTIGVALLAAAALLSFFWPWVADELTQSGQGQAIAFASGMSAWPSVALRIIGAALAVGLAIDSHRQLNKNLEDIRKKYGLPEMNDGGVKSCLSSFRKFREAFSYRLIDPEKWDKHAVIDVGPVWETYQRRENCRLVRVIVYVAAFILISYLLTWIFGRPQAPWRGAYSLTYTVSIFALIMGMLSLLFIVFDATLLCLSFARILHGPTTNWPDNAHNYALGELGFRGALIDEWLDLQFIAKRTSVLSTMIYYPFAIITLVILSRSSAIADYAPSYPVIISASTSLLLVFTCALLLGSTAVRARETSKRKLFHCLNRKPNDENSELRQHQEILLNRINAIHSGAFVPFLQQAPVRALLFPLTGFGWTAFMEHAWLFGLN